MRIPILMPNLGSEAPLSIASWLRHVGERVTRGEPVAEIETEKATVEMDSSASGTLVEIVQEAGSQVAAGEPIAYIEADDE